MSEEKKVQRTIVGRVVSDKMDKTVSVAIERKIKHPIIRSPTHEYVGRYGVSLWWRLRGVQRVGIKRHPPDFARKSVAGFRGQGSGARSQIRCQVSVFRFQG